MSLPKTFKQAAFRSAGADLTVEDAELKLPGPGEVLVKVEACGVCFSDSFAQRNGMGGVLYVRSVVSRPHLSGQQ
jgi:D-arabinose 1-dehydrogenase-like Zn-dependent alcohol dehydrogenase